MLPGRRTFSDEDIIGVLTEALNCFKKLDEAEGLPSEFRLLLLQHVIGMVGQREITAPMGSLLGQEIKQHKGH